MTDNPFLIGNFAPVDEELTASDLPVTGNLPRELEGRLLRIGPNPIAPDPAKQHWFLGNGMVHGVRLRDGRAEWYRNRFVRDDEVVQARGWSPVEGPRPAQEIGGGVVNTNVIGHGGRTFATVEAGNFPVELSYELETVARSDFGGTLTGGFTAHPKRDPDTGELHAAVYSPFWEHVQYVVVGADGRVRRSVEVPAPGKPMVHDCAITESWFVVFDLPCIFDPQMLVEGYSLPYRWNAEYEARVGLVRRESDDPVIWSGVEPCYVFHPMNAYEDAAGRVVLDVVRHPKMFANDLRGPNEGAPTLDRWIVDPRGGSVKEQRLDDTGQEFPRHDERLVSEPYRYGYTADFGAGLAMGGLYQHDLRDGTVTAHSEGKDRFFLEPVFVPARDDAAEDDGWVLAFVYDASTDKSDVVVLHAQDFAGPPVATIHLPQRVPYGFHGNWIPD
jgi:carotenoid cleavage dioxygenase-like enzyme